MAVPLFKIGLVGDYVRCKKCQTFFQADILRLSRDQVQKAAAPWICHSCCRENSFRAVFCATCRAPRQTRPLVSTTPSNPPPLPGKTPPPIPLGLGLDPWVVITTPPAIVVPAWKVIATNILRACVIGMVALIICTGGHEEEVFDKIFGTVGETQFKAADALIDNDKIHDEANGNNPEAVALANRLVPALAEKRMPGVVAIAQNDFDKNDGKFLVFCQLNKDSCVFLIHVPNISVASEETQTEIARQCYAVARGIMAQSSAKNISHVIVSLRSWAAYKITLEGNDPPGAELALDKLEPMHTYSSGATDLYPYFAPQPAEKSAASAASTPSATPVPATPATPVAATPAPSTPEVAKASVTPVASTPAASAADAATPAISPAQEAAPVAARPASKPRELPAWVPIYPGLARAPRGPASEANGVVKGRANFDTTDSIDQVKSFYQDKLKEAGFELTETSPTGRLFERTKIEARNDAAKKIVRAEIVQMKSRAIVTLNYEGPEEGGAISSEPK
jgi:hypothetical protein